MNQKGMDQANVRIRRMEEEGVDASGAIDCVSFGARLTGTLSESLVGPVMEPD